MKDFWQLQKFSYVLLSSRLACQRPKPLSSLGQVDIPCSVAWSWRHVLDVR